MIEIKKGLDIPISGSPDQTVVAAPNVRSVALVGEDFVGMKPTMAVQEGDRVKLAQTLFTDKRNPGVQYTSPGAGTIVSVNRGKKRRFLSVIVRLDDQEGEASFSQLNPASAARESITENLVAAGLWPALRTRPFNRVPEIDSEPHSIFVTAMDTNPLSADPAPLIAARGEDFVLGLHALTQLTDGTVFVCTADGVQLPGNEISRVKFESFRGPHPAGLPGTHIHFLDPVHANKTVWFIGYQDVIAYGFLCRTGRLDVERVVSLAGPGVKEPRLIRTRMGASIDDLVDGQLLEGDQELRVISGSVLSGRTSNAAVSYLGRYHQQISVLAEGKQREFLGWAMPGFNKLSITPTFAAGWLGGRGRRFDLTTNTGGSRRAMVPIGVYEKVVPLDTIPTFLLRALIVEDTEQAQELGCLELDEEDLALCSFVCPSKYEYGPILRKNLTQIELEG